MSELIGISILIASLLAGLFVHRKRKPTRKISIGRGKIVKRKQS